MPPGSIYAGALVLTGFIPEMSLWPTPIALTFGEFNFCRGAEKAVLLETALFS